MRPPLWLLVTITIGASVGMHLIVPALAGAAEALQVSAGQMQLSVTVYLLALALGQLLWGPVSDSLGRRRTLIWGISLFTAGGLAAAASTSLDMMLAARVVQGLGAACGMSLGRAIIRDTTEGVELVRQLALLSLIVLLSPGLSPMLGGLIAAALGWRAVLVLLGILGLFSLWMTRQRLPETCAALRPFDLRRIAADYSALVRDFRFIALAVGTAGVNTSTFAFLAAAPVLLTRQMGLSLAEVGLYSGLVMLGLAVGNGLTSALVRRFGPRRLARTGLLLALASALGLLALVLLDRLTLAGLLGTLVLLNCGAGMATPALLARAYALRPGQTGTAAGVQGCAQMVMATLSGSLVAPDQNPALSCAVTVVAMVGVSSLGIALASDRGRR